MTHPPTCSDDDLGPDLTVEPSDRDPVRDLVTDSWRATAPKRLVAEMDAAS